MINNSGQVVFTQKRPGRNGKIFKILKFKTMNDRVDERGQLLPNHKRLTQIGRFLRNYSLDELPQLINVIKGDMSLVGPRPLHVKYLDLYNEEQSKRHDVRGGITGWAQVNGRNAISWEDKFKFDVWYVNNLTLLLDIKIFWLTLVKLMNRDSINRSRDTTMPPFQGSNTQ